MEDNNDKKKIILKRDALPGVDMSISDFTQVHTVTVVWTSVTKKMYKKYKQTFIGIKEKLNEGEVIRVGSLGLLYRVIKLTQYTDTEGFIHRVQRVDGASTTATDIDAIEVGDKVKITNRRSFQQKLNYAQSLRDGFAEEDCGCECEEEYPELCADKPFTPSTRTSLEDEITKKCNQYQITVPAGFEDGRRTEYIDCEGNPQVIEHPGSKADIFILVCTLEDPTYVNYEPSNVELVGECGTQTEKDYYQYRVDVEPLTSAGELVYETIGEGGGRITQTTQLISTRTGYSITFCAFAGTVTIGGNTPCIINETPAGEPCITPVGITVTRLGLCP